MKALTHLKRSGGDYAAAVNHFAETLDDAPKRGQVVEWEGEQYRLNRRAVSDTVFAHHNGGYEEEQGMPQSRDFNPCPNGHPEQAHRAIMGLPTVPCYRCGETPVFTGFAQNFDPSLPGYEP